jgi:hypothetical protein
MVEDVRAGLLAVPKDLSPWPKYFYDEKGSELFEEITALPEYYQTRTELSILQEKAPEIVARTGCRELVELGSGSSSKTRVLLDAMVSRSGSTSEPGTGSLRSVRRQRECPRGQREEADRGVPDAGDLRLRWRLRPFPGEPAGPSQGRRGRKARHLPRGYHWQLRA